MADSTAQVVQTVGAVFALLLLAAATNALAKRIGIRFPIALVLVGVAISELGEVFDFLAPLARIDISPTVAFFVFLPTLVFEAAFNMDGRDLRENLGPILTLAVPALLLSTLLTGVILWIGAPLVGFELSAPEALLLGSILSATDPVGVTELFRQIGAPRRLTVLVEGESLFNDATAIALSRLLLGILLGPVNTI